MLKYLVLTSMLMKSEINPFDSQETKPYTPPPIALLILYLIFVSDIGMTLALSA